PLVSRHTADRSPGCRERARLRRLRASDQAGRSRSIAARFEERSHRNRTSGSRPHTHESGCVMTKILLVEDNEMNRDMLGRRLQRQGFTVCFAIDGPSGVKMAADEVPDLILMDVALGDMDGWEATRLIKANPDTREIPIIALTAHALASDRDTSVK